MSVNQGHGESGNGSVQAGVEVPRMTFEAFMADRVEGLGRQFESVTSMLQGLGVVVQQLQQKQQEEQKQNKQAVPVQAIPAANNSQIDISRVTKLPTFDGNKKSNAQEWIVEVQNYFQACNVTPIQQVPVAIQLLRSDAAIWWASLNITPQSITWQEFKKQFADNYQPVASSETARTALYSLVHRRGTSVVDYIKQFRYYLSLMDANEMSEDMKIFMFQRGLQYQTQNEVRIRNPSTLIQAMSYAQSAEIHRDNNKIPYNPPRNNSSQFNSYRPPINQFRSSNSYRSNEAVPMELGNVSVEEQDYVPEDQDNQLNAMHQQFRVPNLSKQAYDQCRQQNTCFKCKRTGHIARECRSQPRNANNNYNNQSKNGQGQRQQQ